MRMSDLSCSGLKTLCYLHSDSNCFFSFNEILLADSPSPWEVSSHFLQKWRQKFPSTVRRITSLFLFYFIYFLSTVSWAEWLVERNPSHLKCFMDLCAGECKAERLTTSNVTSIQNWVCIKRITTYSDILIPCIIHIKNIIPSHAVSY